MTRFPSLLGRRSRAIFDRLRTKVVRWLDADSLRLEGHVYVQVGNHPEMYLGRNIITDRMSLNVAGLLATTIPPAGGFIGDIGFNESDPVFPVELVVGTGTTPAAKTDLVLQTPILTPSPGLVDVVYPLDQVLVYQTKAPYGTDPIAVSFFFDIPAGEAYDDGLGGSTTNVVIREWGMRASNGDLLTRKVATIDKLSELDLRVRWEIRS